MGYVDVGEEDHWGAERSDAEEDEGVAAEPDSKRQKTGKQDKGATIFQDVCHILSSKQVSQLAASLALCLSTNASCRGKEEGPQGLKGSQAEHPEDVYSSCR